VLTGNSGAFHLEKGARLKVQRTFKSRAVRLLSTAGRGARPVPAAYQGTWAMQTDAPQTRRHIPSVIGGIASQCPSIQHYSQRSAMT
jgi:hypothetical protein